MATRASWPSPEGERLGPIVAVVVAAVLLSGASGCGGRDRSFFAAYGKAGSTKLELNVDSCNENPRAHVVESATEVHVRVISDRRLGRNGGDCADSVTVTLSEPLGTRLVVDESTGDVVEIQAPD
jgi:hypothetical protein